MMKKSRRNAPKVRTGCFSCKTRRVKCDERRPSCLRCERFGVACDGYLPPKSPSQAVQSQGRAKRNLLPKVNIVNEILPQLSSSIPFDSENDYQYCYLFCNKISIVISPYFDPERWQRLILQACAMEPSIRFVAIAIGALGKAYATTRTPNGLGNLDGKAISSPGTQLVRGHRPEKTTESVVHHQNALKKYEKALRHAIKAMSSGQQSVRTTLITCILVVCFEQLHGNHESAKLHLLTGLRVLHEWKIKQREEYKHPLGFSSPAPDVVEDFLVQTFGRLEIQAISQGDCRPLEYHEAVKGEGKDEVEKMPELFKSIGEARVYLDLIMRRSMHYNVSMASREVILAPPGLETEEPCGDANVYQLDPKLFRHPLVLPKSSNPMQEARAHIGELTSWIVAFDSLLQTSIKTGGFHRISALALSIAAITTRIAGSMAFASTEMAYDIYSPDFRKVVLYSRMLLETAQTVTPDFMPDTTFSFDLGVIAPLYIIVTKCRDFKTRHEAIDLLLKYPRKEGLWDSHVTSAFGRWLADIEEEGMVDGKIPEVARVHSRSVKYDPVKRMARMRCSQRDKVTGEMVLREEYHPVLETSLGF